MKVGFITAIREDIESYREYFLKRHMANLAPMYLASFLDQFNLPIEISIKDRFEDFSASPPDILGISSVTENFDYAKSLARRAKESWDSITIIGGVHITNLPQTLPPEFDVGVVGEGEETFHALISQILKVQTLPNQEMLGQIPGLVFHTQGGVKRSEVRKGIQDIDQIPKPAREKYLKTMGTTYMMTSRGCPYTCDFCVIPSISEGYRKHSPEYVIEEIKSIKKHYPLVKHIRIFDDLFIVDAKRVQKIAELVDAEGLNKELTFGCWGRANLIDEKMARALKKLNVLYVAFGAESGSSKIMSEIKPGCSVEDNQRCINLLADHGIRASTSVLMGHPKETEEDLWETYRFIDKNFDKLFEVEFNVAIPWPGTELWRYAKSRGLVQDEMSFAPLRECAYFMNYCTDYHPYLNPNIEPHRFDRIMADFKVLFKKMVEKLDDSGVFHEVNPENSIPAHY